MFVHSNDHHINKIVYQQPKTSLPTYSTPFQYRIKKRANNSKQNFVQIYVSNKNTSNYYPIFEIIIKQTIQICIIIIIHFSQNCSHTHTHTHTRKELKQ